MLSVHFIYRKNEKELPDENRLSLVKLQSTNGRTDPKMSAKLDLTKRECFTFISQSLVSFKYKTEHR